MHRNTLPQILTVRHAVLAVASSFLLLSTAVQADTAPPQDIRFREFFNSPIGREGLTVTPRLKAVDGQRVRIVGYMVAEEEMPTGRFFLTPVPVRMSEHADGDADDLPPSTVVVFMPAGDNTRALPHTPGLLSLTGTLETGRLEMTDGRVSWVRLRLDPPSSNTASLTSSGAKP